MTFLEDYADIPAGALVSLYGAGKFGGLVREYLARRRSDVTVLRYMDSFKRGSKGDLPVLRPEDLAGPEEAGLVLVTSFSYKPIAAALAERGFPNVLVAHPLLNLGEFLTLEEHAEHASDYARAEARLVDPADRAMYRSLVQARVVDRARVRRAIAEGREAAADLASEITPYPAGGAIYEDYVNWSRVRCAVEGGVYKGEVTARLLELLPRDGRVVGFEPYPDAWGRSSLRPGIEADPRASLDFRGLWSEPGSMTLLPGGGASCLVRDASSGDNTVQVELTTLDAAMAERGLPRLDYLKLDVEGAELDVLAGGRQTLLRDRPQIAVCLYHTKHDLHTIPNFLGDLLPDYVYRLGHYAQGYQETVLYALPREALA
jgi:FkbM family methyltransferase